MSYYADFVRGGIWPLRHEDPAFDVSMRVVRFGARIGGPDVGLGRGFTALGAIVGESEPTSPTESHGDILGAGLWPRAKAVANDRRIPGWNWAWASVTPAGTDDYPDVPSGPGPANPTSAPTTPTATGVGGERVATGIATLQSNGIDFSNYLNPPANPPTTQERTTPGSVAPPSPVPAAAASGGGSTREKGTSQAQTLTPTAGPPPQVVTVQPVFSAMWDGDARFLPKQLTTPPYISKLPGGIAGATLTATRETSQEDVFLPCGFGTLVAPHFQGDPDVGSSVFDLTRKNDLDLVRRARLQSLARVYEVPKAFNQVMFGRATKDHGLAWQLGTARGGFGGCGIVADYASVFAPPIGSTQGQSNLINVTGSGGVQSGTISGDTTTLNGKVVSGSGQTVARQNLGSASASAGASVAGPEILAASTYRANGPLHVGAFDDKHRFGVNSDSEGLNSLHLSTDAYFWMDKSRDAPLKFDVVPWQRPDPDSGSWHEVYLRYDERDLHDWQGSQRTGKWKWQVQLPFYKTTTASLPGVEDGFTSTVGVYPDVGVGSIPGVYPDYDVNSIPGVAPDVDYTSTPGVNPDPGPNTGPLPPDTPGGDPGGGHFTTANVNPETGQPQPDVGFQDGPSTATSIGGPKPFGMQFMTTVAVPSSSNIKTRPIQQPARQNPKNLPTVGTLSALTAPQLNLRATNFNKGASDLRFGGWTPDDAALADTFTPNVASFTTFGTELGSGWHYFDGPGAGLYGPTTAGVVHFGPANQDPTQIIDGTGPSTSPTATLNVSSRAFLGIGATPTTTGVVKNGYLISGNASDFYLDGVNGTGALDANSPLHLSRDSLTGTLFGQQIVSVAPSATNGQVPVADGAGSYAWGAASGSSTPGGLFGDGSDGTATADGSTAILGASLAGGTYTLSRDVFYATLTMSGSAKINTNGFRIFVSGTATVGASNVINDLMGSTLGHFGGSAGPTGTVGTAVGGALGATTNNGAGANGNAVSSSFGGNSGAGGTGSRPLNSGAGGSSATATAPAASLGSIHAVPQALLGKVDGFGGTTYINGGAGGAGGGLTFDGFSSGEAGGGGCGGGIVILATKKLVNSGTIHANGLPGANGTVGGSVAGAGGGGGGGGGTVVVVYGSSGSTLGTVTASGGAGGTGAQIGAGATGANGSPGLIGTVVTIAV